MGWQRATGAYQSAGADAEAVHGQVPGALFPQSEHGRARTQTGNPQTAEDEGKRRGRRGRPRLLARRLLRALVWLGGPVTERQGDRPIDVALQDHELPRDAHRAIRRAERELVHARVDRHRLAEARGQERAVQADLQIGGGCCTLAAGDAWNDGGDVGLQLRTSSQALPLQEPAAHRLHAAEEQLLLLDQVTGLFALLRGRVRRHARLSLRGGGGAPRGPRAEDQGHAARPGEEPSPEPEPLKRHFDSRFSCRAAEPRTSEPGLLRAACQFSTRLTLAKQTDCATLDVNEKETPALLSAPLAGVNVWAKVAAAFVTRSPALSKSTGK